MRFSYYLHFMPSYIVINFILCLRDVISKSNGKVIALRIDKFENVKVTEQSGKNV